MSSILRRDYAAPSARCSLATRGAEVIKIEPPAGDFARRMGPPFVGDESAVFLSLNRNKKSVVLDLETSNGREAAARLARDADIVVEDFGPGAAEEIGLGYAQLRERKSETDLLLDNSFRRGWSAARSSGLRAGRARRWRSIARRWGESAILQCASAPMSRALTPESFAAQAILAALFHRIRTGEGQRVAVSQFGSLLHMRGIMWHSMSDPDDWYGFHLDHYTNAA